MDRNLLWLYRTNINQYNIAEYFDDNNTRIGLLQYVKRGMI